MIAESQHEEEFRVRSETYKALQSIEGVNKELSQIDLNDLLVYPGMYIDKPFNEITDDEFREIITKKWLTNRLYHVYFPLYNVYNFPDGYKLGYGILYIFASLPIPIQEYLDEKWRHEFDRNRGYAANIDEFLKRKRDSTFLYVSVKSYGQDKAGQKATELADESMHILRAVYGADFNLKEYVYIEDAGKYPGGREMGEWASASYAAILDNNYTELTEILTKARPSELETRLRNSIRLFALAIEAIRPEIRYTLLTTALESMLLIKGNYLRFKLAEKVAFLLGKDKEQRLKLFQNVKDLYDKRSDFVHQNPKYKPITEDDVTNLWETFTNIFHKLLELRDQGYTQVEKKEGIKTIEDLIDDLKFT